MKNDLVVILILNFNRQEDLLECLNSVNSLEYSHFEIVVVDNGSTDSSVFSVKHNYPFVHVLESKTNLGAASGRNYGIKYVNEKFDYEYLFFLDNDIIIAKHTLSEMINSLNSSDEIGIVTPKCYTMSEQKTFAYAGGIDVNLFTGKIKNIGFGQVDRGQYDKSKFVTACGGLFLTTKQVMSKVGMFDSNFDPYGWEDVDFGLRARKLDYKILYNPNAIIYHKGGKENRKENVDVYENSKVRNYFYLLKKHANSYQILTLILFLPVRSIGVIVRELYNGKFDVLVFKMKGLFSLFKRNF